MMESAGGGGRSRGLNSLGYDIQRHKAIPRVMSNTMEPGAVFIHAVEQGLAERHDSGTKSDQERPSRRHGRSLAGEAQGSKQIDQIHDRLQHIEPRLGGRKARPGVKRLPAVHVVYFSV